MNINDLYSSRFLKAEDLKNQSISSVIERIDFVDLDDGRKPVVTLHGHMKKLCLNKTNCYSLANAYGLETDLWIGKHIQIATAYVNFKGRKTLGQGFTRWKLHPIPHLRRHQASLKPANLVTFRFKPTARRFKTFF